MNTEPEQKVAAKANALNVKKPKKEKKEKKKKTLVQEILSWVFTLLFAVVAATLIRMFIFEPIRVDGRSMMNTLQDGEVVYVSKLDYLGDHLQRGDVVICRYPNRNTKSSFSLGGSFEVTLTNHTLFVKRLIALPGDTLEIRSGVVYVNGEQVDESGIDFYSTSATNLGPVVLGADSYFVMGDNRGNSNDSRAVGPITRDMIVGHVKFVLWPLSSFGKSIK